LTWEDCSVKRWSSFILVIFIWLLAGEAYAACTVSATGVNFGNYDTFVATPLETTGTVTVNCDLVQGQPPDVTISISTSSNSGVFNPRQMKHAAQSDLLDYNLYTKQNRTTVWGDGTAGTSSIVIKGTQQKKATIYGSIPPRQNVPPGTYSDILTVTITP
jgi:spore coat protein U-like protein